MKYLIAKFFHIIPAVSGLPGLQVGRNITGRKGDGISRTLEMTKKRNAGFTLVEMLVATSLFSVVILSATDIFIRVQHAQRQAAVLEKTQSISRFILTRMAQEIESGSIDYDYYYGTPSTPTPGDNSFSKREDARIFSRTLALRTAEGERLLFTTRPKGQTDFDIPCVDDTVSPCLIIATSAPTTQAERMNPPGYTIQKLLFVITPGKDPFVVDPVSNDFLANAQPKVTIMLSVRSTVAGIKTPFDLTTQTTVSTREYRR